MTLEPKWRRFEKLVAQVQQQLAPSALVIHNDHIYGINSGEQRQVDITVRQKIGQYDILIAIDCKDYQIPVDVKDVEEFIGLIKDIKANKGAMVAANGFTVAGKRVGKNAGLDLFRLVDTDAHDWQTYVSVPMLCDFRGIEKYQFAFNTSIAHIFAQITTRQELENITFYEANHKPIGDVISLLKASWNSGKLPTNPGEHTNIALTPEPLSILCDNEFFEVNVFANIVVRKRLFFGQLPLLKIKGFRDECSGGLITREFITDWLNMDDVEKSWQRLQTEGELAITPLLKLEALDVMTI